MVTLLVTPEDAERLALAANEGQIMLTLRNPLDVSPTETAGVRMAGLLGPPSSPPVEKKPETRSAVRPIKKPAEPVPPPPRLYTVEAIRAAKRTEEPVR